MNGQHQTKQLLLRRRMLCMIVLGSILAAWAVACSSVAAGEPRIVGPWRDHVDEVEQYLECVEVYAPIRYRHLAVFPLRLREGETLRGSWLTMDQALARRVLAVEEKGRGSVPLVVVENRSRDDTVFIMSGEILAGGKQTRTVRQDVVLSPGQRVELRVFCVEQRRWKGEMSFRASQTLLPQSIQQALRKGADQGMIWSEVERNNRALGVETETGSLDQALNSEKTRSALAAVRGKILPAVPADTVGFIFVSGHRALGAEFFGRPDLAKALLPKLLDSYSVDCLLQYKGRLPADEKTQESVALNFFERIRHAGSQRVSTPGSGAGIQTRTHELLGDGVSIGGVLVHFGVQADKTIIPRPMPKPLIEQPPRR